MERQTGPLRAAVVGCGNGGLLSARALRDSPDFSLVALCDYDASARNRANGELGPTQMFEDHRSMLVSLDPDVVCVSTWAQSHPAIARDCLEAGVRGLLVEKPIALSYREAAALVDLIRVRGVPCVVPHGLLVRSTSVEILARLRQGDIGEIKVIEIQCDGWDIINAGIHWIDFALAALEGDRVGGVLAACDSSTHTHRDRVKVETDAVTYVEMRSGARIVMRTGNRVNVSREGKDLTIRFFGDSGTLEMWGWQDSYRIFNSGSPKPQVIQRSPDPESVHRRHLERLARMIDSAQSDYGQVDLSLAALEVCQAAYLSSRTQRMIDLPLDQSSLATGGDWDNGDWDLGTPYLGEPGPDGRLH